MNEANNSIEDKIALIKMSFRELDDKELTNSFKSLIESKDHKLKEE